MRQGKFTIAADLTSLNVCVCVCVTLSQVIGLIRD